MTSNGALLAAGPADNLHRQFAQRGTVAQDRRRWPDRTENRNQYAVAFDAMDHAHHSVACVLHRSNVRGEVFRHTKRVEQLQFLPHDRSPRWARFSNTTSATCGKWQNYERAEFCNATYPLKTFRERGINARAA